MRYRNIKTGLTFCSNCYISGEDYELISEVKETPKAEKVEKAEPKEVKPKTTTKRAKR